ncbi:C2H2 finger domain protein (Gli3), putative [Paecilomyces variotii No. 5]|uniref:C2H2 finger domain protein (Gli3), putative n=1 Tax=Byssochlamys spectabilis (strain No. 5 / NBRC 109023) TaxID=1356009 RepID=V5G6V5_BYSSN|nr:C2H2 finger domain protein (Gli3), putative [Paecilomyces variotii No. 5]
MAESPGSPLSSIASDDLTEDMKLDNQGQSPSAANMPPSKRRRTGIASWDRQTPMSSVHEDIPPTSPSTSISSDSSGDIPNSPNTAALIGGGQDDDYSGQGSDQVTVCRWEGCDAGDLGNMDDLVQHIHNEHIGIRQKKYSCEWVDCSRKGQTHASGYALRAHMRSHTREKPFYCALPECDRSFTRSDALAKHMRTVHETEALRPSDPVPKNHNPLGSTATPTSKLQRIKLKLSYPPREDTEQLSDTNIEEAPDTDELDSVSIPDYGPELGFDEEELALRPYDLYRLLRRQIHWAERESAQLRLDWEKIEPRRRQAFKEKESIFDDIIEAEVELIRTIWGTDEASPQASTVANGLGQLQHKNDMPDPDGPAEPASAPAPEPVAG